MLKRILALFLAAITILSFTSTVYAANADAQFVLFSDIHINGATTDAGYPKEFPNWRRNIANALNYANKTDSKLAVCSGDLSNGIYNGEWSLYATDHELSYLYNEILHDKYPDVTFIACAGNHDFYNQEPTADSWFVKFQQRYIPGLNKTYYSYEQNGCKFIVLGAEVDPTGEHAVYYWLDCQKANGRANIYISEKQLKWFESELKSASSKGCPIFVIAHNPLEDEKDPLQDLGNQAEDVKKLMLKYSERVPVVYCSGHYHHSLTKNSITQEGTSNLYYIDSPSLALDGTGFVISISNEKITIKGYDFGNNTDLGALKEITIKNKPINIFQRIWKFIKGLFERLILFIITK